MVTAMADPMFLSCDWGTSRFRLRLVDAHLHIIADHESDDGIQTIAARHDADGRGAAFEAVLNSGLEKVGANNCPELPLVISGMASANIGWRPLPYAEAPTPVDGSGLRYEDMRQGKRRIRLLSGLRTADDVMRGEETEVVGLHLAGHLGDKDCTLLLPGTHSKHVRVASGNITGFSTFLTGELYGLLMRDSTLRTDAPDVFNIAAFAAGVETTNELGMSAALFRTRSRYLLHAHPAAASGSFLSGVLVGAEIASLVPHQPRQVVIASTSTTGALYAEACRILLPSTEVKSVAANDCVAALVAAHRALLDR